MNLNQTVDIGTDIASFFLFHPDDLAHRSDNPLDWHSYDFTCLKEFEAGNMVAFRTGSDGGYQLRVTDGDLTETEHALEAGSWEWGYTVRHGKILVDNGDYLPSEDAFDLDEVPEDHWVTLPNGDYRVIVHPIERNDDSLPDYVIRFEPVDKLLHNAKSASPPDLIPLRSQPPSPSIAATANDIYTEGSDKSPLAEIYPLLVEAGSVVLPGGSISVAVEDALYEAATNDDSELMNTDGDFYVVSAPSENIPETATVCWVNGMSQMDGEPGKLRLSGKRLVRIIDCHSGKLLPRARVEPVTRANFPLPEPDIKALQTAFAKYAEKKGKGKNKITSFERERIAAITESTPLTARLVELVEMPVVTRLRLYGLSDTERAKELMPLLESK